MKIVFLQLAPSSNGSIFYVPEQTFDVLVKNTQSFLRMLAIPRIHIGEILSFAESLSLDKTQIELQKIVNIVKVICFLFFYILSFKSP